MDKSTFNASAFKVAQYGFYHGRFGQLPTFDDYRQLQQAKHAIDITPEVRMLAQHPLSELHVTVPCLSFTDPLLDFALFPWFVLPLSVNGYIADNVNPTLSRAKLIATDIMNNQYPILLNHFGIIDYDLIQSKLEAKRPFFSALKAITFVYSCAQVTQGQGLTRVLSQHTNTLEMMLARSCPEFTVCFTVIDKAHRVLGKRELPFSVKTTEPEQSLQARLKPNQVGCELTLHYQSKSQPFSYADWRSHLEIMIPMQQGLTYEYQGRQQAGKANEYLALNHYIKAGRMVLNSLIECLMPRAKFIAGIMEQDQNQAHPRLWNQYHDHAQAANALYDDIVLALMRGAVPLVAFKPYFVSEATALESLKKVVLAQCDRQDMYITQTIIENVSNQKTAFWEALDDLLCEKPQEIDETYHIQITGTESLPAHTMIKATLTLENGAQCVQYTRQARLGDGIQAKRHIEYTITLPQVREHEMVIEGFDYHKDKINLSALIDALQESPEHSTVIRAKITPEGDTQIWVEHHQTNTSQQLHVATIKGMTPYRNRLPQNLHHFIVGLR